MQEQPMKNEPEPDTQDQQSKKPDLAVALEPFGYRKDPVTGRRSTTIKALPAILKDFQDSRQTLYFPDSVIDALRNYTESDDDPDKLIGDDELQLFFDNAQASQLSTPSPVTSPPRIRTAESPSSSRSDRQDVFASSPPPSPTPDPTPADESQQQTLNQPDSSFESLHQDSSFNSSANHSSNLDPNSFSSPPRGIAPNNPTLASIRSQRHRSLPLDYPDTQHRKPRPPNRRKRGSNATDSHKHTSSINPSSLNRSTNTSHSSSSHIPEDNDPQLNPDQSYDDPVLESAFISPSPQLHPSSPDPPNLDPNALLTPNNLSSVIFKNRQLGLYDSPDDHYQFQPQSTTPGSDDSNPNDIIRRLRSEVTARPDSKVYTRVFESTSIEEFNHRAREQEEEMLHTNSEDYPNLIRKCEAYRIKNKELENQISKLEKMHEDEIMSLSDQLDERNQELSSCKKSEKDLANANSKLRFQLSNSDDQMARMNKESNLLQESYQKMKQKWDEAVGESEKLRVELKLRNEELRSANHSIESHASDMKKCESDQQLREEHIKNLKAELEELQTTRSILEEQKQANLGLKATIDKLKYELEEQKIRNAGSSVGGSRPTSIAGSLNQRLGEEFKKVIASGDYGKNEDDDDGSETTGGDDTEDLDRIVKDLDPNITDHEYFDQIRITRSRYSRFPVNAGSTGDGGYTQIHEEVIELREVQTNTDDLINVESKKVQTDPIPEPPPVYRPKTEELQVQTEASAVEDEGSKDSSLLKLVAGIDPEVLKLAIDHIHQQQTMAQNQLSIDSQPPPPLPSSSSSAPPSSSGVSSNDSDSDDDEETSSDGSEDEDRNQSHQRSPLFSSYLSRIQYISSSLLDPSIFSPIWIFSSLPTFGILANKNTTTTTHIITKHKKKKSSRSKNHSSQHVVEGKLAKNIRICSATFLLLATGYYLGNKLFPPDLNYYLEGQDSKLFKCKNCSFIQYEAPYSIGFFSPSSNIPNSNTLFTTSSSSSSGRLSGGGGASSGGRSNANSTDQLNHSFVHLKRVGLHHLADFNAVGLGHEGFFVQQLRNHVSTLAWLKNLGTSLLGRTFPSVTSNQQSPT